MSLSSSPSPRVLLAVSSSSSSFWPLGLHTGYFFTEVVHPYLTFKNHGFEIECVSETGSASIDQSSIPYAELDAESRKIYHDKNHPLWSLLGPELKSPSSIRDPSVYNAIYFCGGHGAAIDFPKAEGLQKIGSEIYSAGGVIAAVCHGPAIFAGLKDKNSGELIIRGKKATGFSERGEKMMMAEGKMKEFGMATMREVISSAGGIWQEPTDVATNPMSPFVVVDGRIVTGVNPMSAADVAQKTVELLNGPSTEDRRPKKSVF